MNIGLLIHNLDLIIALSAAISVFAAIFVVSWPYVVRDHLAERWCRSPTRVNASECASAAA